ncbi:LUD domain-containing protein [Halosimplex halobium]|uniref:LUD domain-containing protein n=1 Tax=Halosimplex halobium TaxID=3396618 RepID=UPI003F57C32A
MSAVDEFTQSLERRDTELTAVAPSDFGSALAELVDTPAAGAPLPFEDLSLSGAPVTVDPSPDQLKAAKTGVTGARMAVASLGTVALESRPGGDELVSLFPQRHVVVVKASQLRPDLASAFEWLDDEFDGGSPSVVLATGPSATGDMGALVQGVHGPETVHVLLVRDDE